MGTIVCGICGDASESCDCEEQADECSCKRDDCFICGLRWRDTAELDKDFGAK